MKWKTILPLCAFVFVSFWPAARAQVEILPTKRFVQIKKTKALPAKVTRAQKKSLERIVSLLKAGYVRDIGDIWNDFCESYTDESTTEKELGSIGDWVVGTSYLEDKPDLDSLIEKWEEELQTVGDDAQLANVDMQNMLQKTQQTLQMMSQISKQLHDTALAVIRKMGG